MSKSRFYSCQEAECNMVAQFAPENKVVPRVCKIHKEDFYPHYTPVKKYLENLGVTLANHEFQITKDTNKDDLCLKVLSIDHKHTSEFQTSCICGTRLKHLYILRCVFTNNTVVPIILGNECLKEFEDHNNIHEIQLKKSTKTICKKYNLKDKGFSKLESIEEVYRQWTNALPIEVLIDIVMNEYEHSDHIFIGILKEFVSSKLHEMHCEANIQNFDQILSLDQLKTLKKGIPELKNRFSLSELSKAFSVEDLKLNGFTVKDFFDNGVCAEKVEKIFTFSEMRFAGYSLGDLSLFSCGIENPRTNDNYELERLMREGKKPWEIIKKGYLPEQLTQWGQYNRTPFRAGELKTFGYTEEEITRIFKIPL